MKKRFLQLRVMAKAVMIALLIGIIGSINGYAWDHNNITIDDLLYNLNDNSLTAQVIGHIQSTSATGNLIIPSSVTYTDDMNITRTYSVTIIGTCAFINCYGFTSLSIPNSVKWIYDSAFSGCSGFTGSLIIPNSVYQIGEEAFSNCSGFDGTLVIGKSVNSIGYHAFVDCRNFNSMYCLADTPPMIGWNAFYRFPTNIPVYVPYGQIDSYRVAMGWSVLSNYNEMAYTTIPAYSEGSNNWRFIASPLVDSIAPTAVNNLITETEYDLYQFNPTGENGEWENYKADSFNLVNSRGYLYANAEEVNVIFKGEFNEDETKVVELIYDEGNPKACWNLLGNPFPVSAYLNKPYYMMKEDGSGINPEAVPVSTPIPPCTGVFVKAESEGETVVFTRAVP